MNQKNPSHPTRDQLKAFSLGDLAPKDSAKVEGHVEECPACSDTLLSLSSASDTFVSSLRRACGQEHDAPDQDPANPAKTVALVSDEDEISARGESLDHPEFGGSMPVQLAQHPRYRIVELVGSGGMGNVYKAEHKLMNRTVALKVINQDLVANPQAVERFRREVQAAARLSHANIVTAHDAEQAGDVHFLVMEYVEGTDLSELVKRRGPLSATEASLYVEQAANGLQEAHELGLVHRDIKPHNLMIAADGQLKILDFGLASFVSDSSIVADTQDTADNDRSAKLTSLGSTIGTPDYISPEQASDAGAVDIRSDIYSLGCTLYFLLAGTPPYPDGKLSDKLRAHAEDPPQDIGLLRPDLPLGLANVLRRMMAKNADERFQTPKEVAAALAAFGAKGTAGSSDAPKTSSPGLRLVTGIVVALLCEGTALSGTLGVAEAAILAAIGFSALAWAIAPVLHDGWRTIRRVTLTGLGLVGVILAGVYSFIEFGKGEFNVMVGPGLEAAQDLDILLRRDGADDETIAVAQVSRGGKITRRVHAGEYTVELRGAVEGVKLQVWSRGSPVDHERGGIMLVRGGSVKIELTQVEVGQPPTAASGKPIATLRRTVETDRFHPLNVAFSPYHQWLASSAGDGTIKLWLVNEHDRYRKTILDDGPRDVWSLAFSPDGKWLASAVSQHGFRLDPVPRNPLLQSIETGSPEGKDFELPQEKAEVHCVAFFPDSKLLATGTNDAIYLWDPNLRGSHQAVVSAHTGMIECMAFSPDGKTLASGGRDGTIRLTHFHQDRRQGIVRRQDPPLVAHTNGVTALIYSLDGSLLISSGQDHQIKIWNAKSGRVMRALGNHKKAVTSLAHHPDRDVFASSSADGTVRLWATRTGNELQVIRQHTDEVRSVAFSPYGKLMATASWDKSIKVWDLNLEPEKSQPDSL